MNVLIDPGNILETAADPRAVCYELPLALSLQAGVLQSILRLLG